MVHAAVFVVVYSFTIVVTPAMAQTKYLHRDTAVLRWLDKPVARVRTIRVPVGKSVSIKTLRVIVRVCAEPPAGERPESVAFLDITETYPGQATQEVFRGWMWSTAPALSAMEHPVYDVWVLDCVAG